MTDVIMAKKENLSFSHILYFLFEGWGKFAFNQEIEEYKTRFTHSFFTFHSVCGLFWSQY